MKSLIILIRIILVGLCWSIFFLEGIRVILLTNWHFDLVDPKHWLYVWNLWLSGWVIDDSREWAFILIILSFIPLWLTGWASLSLIKWEHILARICAKPLHWYRMHTQPQITKVQTKVKPEIKRKKSYKEIRPRGFNIAPSASVAETPKPSPIAANRSLPNVKPIMKPEATPTTGTSSIFDHALFKMDDSDNDFDLSFDDFDKITSPEKITDKKENAPKETTERKDNNKNKQSGKNNGGNQSKENKNAKQPKPSLPMANQPQSTKNSGRSSLEILKQKGYEIISSPTIKNNFVDFIGVSAKQLCVCIVDKESGDWLADEERFNDEEPLWFSENSHRISPVRTADIVSALLKEKLQENGFSFDINTFVIIQYGNIINAEDMFEVWDSMHINVTRIDRGTPRELKLFAKALDDAEESIAPEQFEKVKKIIRNLA